MHLIFNLPFLIPHAAQVLGCCSREAMVGKARVLLSDEQSFHQALGSLFIVINCNLEGKPG